MEDQSEDVESHEEDGGERWYSLLLCASCYYPMPCEVPPFRTSPSARL